MNRDDREFLYVFFNGLSTTEIYTYWHTLSLNEALPICSVGSAAVEGVGENEVSPPVRSPSIAASGSTVVTCAIAGASGESTASRAAAMAIRDRKSTRLNSSH